MVPENIQKVAGLISRFLKKRGIPHAVAGGMAVGAYSDARMTKDVDIVVPAEAESVIAEIAERVGGEISRQVLQGQGGISIDLLTVVVRKVPVDFLLMPSEFPDDLLDNSPEVDGLPVLKPAALVFMKLMAARTKDMADIVEMLKSGRIDKDEVVDYLLEAGQDDMAEELESYAMLAEHEKSKKRPK